MFPYNFTPPYDNNKVTVELREIVESGVDVWAFDYPSYYKGEEKKAFEQKVLDHYWLRQIGQETVGRWLHYFRARIREIMPYYIQLFESQALMHGIEDPFGNVDIVETYEETREETSTGRRDSTSTGKLNSSTNATNTTENSGESSGSEVENATRTEDHRRRFSNTPQGEISNIDKYMTEANVETANDTDNLSKEHEASTSARSTGTASGTQTDSTEGTQADTSEGNVESVTRHTFTKKGNQGVNTYAHDMKELRETFLNIDLQIINELKDLFLQVY